MKEIETKRKADNALAAAQIIQVIATWRLATSLCFEFLLTNAPFVTTRIQFQRKIEEQQIQMNKMQHDHNLVRQTLHNTQAEADMLLQRKVTIFATFFPF